MELIPGTFDRIDSFKPEFNESKTEDGVCDTLKLSKDGHTFVFTLDAVSKTCTLERSYSADGDETNPDDLTRLLPSAKARAEELLDEQIEQLGENFA
jgi:hypothetical protein